MNKIVIGADDASRSITESRMNRRDLLVIAGGGALGASLMHTLPAGAAAASGSGMPPGQWATRYIPDARPMRMGAWDHHVMGLFAPLPEDQRVTAKYYGSLWHTETWFNLFLRNAAGEFRHLSNVAQTPAEGAPMVGHSWVHGQKTAASGDMLEPDSRPQPWSGRIVQTITADGMNQYVIHNRVTREVIRFNEKALEWTADNGDIGLKGPMVTPAMQYMLHWRDPSQNTDLLWYTNQHYKVEGTYYGEHVTGFVVPEHMWGHRNYATTWWVRNRSGVWGYWETEYDDHTFETGMIMSGNGGSRAALILNGKGEKVLNTSEFNVDLSPGNRKVVFEFASGPKWEFVRECSYWLPPQAKAFGTVLELGTTKRVGEARKLIRSSHSVLAVFHDGQGCERVRFGQLT